MPYTSTFTPHPAHSRRLSCWHRPARLAFCGSASTSPSTAGSRLSCKHRSHLATWCSGVCLASTFTPAGSRLSCQRRSSLAVRGGTLLLHLCCWVCAAAAFAVPPPAHPRPPATTFLHHHHELRVRCGSSGRCPCLHHLKLVTTPAGALPATLSVDSPRWLIRQTYGNTHETYGSI